MSASISFCSCARAASKAWRCCSDFAVLLDETHSAASPLVFFATISGQSLSAIFGTGGSRRNLGKVDWLCGTRRRSRLTLWEGSQVELPAETPNGLGTRASLLLDAQCQYCFTNCCFQFHIPSRNREERIFTRAFKAAQDRNMSVIRAAGTAVFQYLLKRPVDSEKTPREILLCVSSYDLSTSHPG
jgi:hypothetical protein